MAREGEGAVGAWVRERENQASKWGEETVDEDAIKGCIVAVACFTAPEAESSRLREATAGQPHPPAG